MTVVTVLSGGIPVVDVTLTNPKLGMPVRESTLTPKMGVAVTKVAAYGIPVTYV